MKNLTLATDTELESEGTEELPMVFVINADITHKTTLLGNNVAVIEHAVCVVAHKAFCWLPDNWVNENLRDRRSTNVVPILLNLSIFHRQ